MAADAQRVRHILKFIGLGDGILAVLDDDCLAVLGSALFVCCQDDGMLKSVLRNLDDTAVQQFFDDAEVQTQLKPNHLICKLHVGAALRRFCSRTHPRAADQLEEEDASGRPSKQRKKGEEKAKKRPDADFPTAGVQRDLWQNWVICGTAHQGDWGNYFSSEEEAKEFLKEEGEGHLWKQRNGGGAGKIKYISDYATFNQGSRFFCAACWNDGVSSIIAIMMMIIAIIAGTEVHRGGSCVQGDLPRRCSEEFW